MKTVFIATALAALLSVTVATEAPAQAPLPVFTLGGLPVGTIVVGTLVISVATGVVIGTIQGNQTPSTSGT